MGKQLENTVPSYGKSGKSELSEVAKPEPEVDPLHDNYPETSPEKDSSRDNCSSNNSPASSSASSSPTSSSPTSNSPATPRQFPDQQYFVQGDKGVWG